MATNSSSSNGSRLTRPPPLSTLEKCLLSTPSSFIFITFNITNILPLVFLSILILHHGLQQWKKKRSSSSSSASSAAMSHSDCLAYHMVPMQLIRCWGSFLCCCSVCMEDSEILLVGFFLLLFTWLGEMFFHLLTCVERYLAVVHPITYLRLRSERGVRMRNINFVCVWLLSGVGTGLWLSEKTFIIMEFCFAVFSLTVVSFCSLSVLCVLIRPGPGERGGNRERVDQSKQRAFYTIVTILGVLVLRFTTSVLWAVVSASAGRVSCVLLSCGFWFCLPSSLVLPLHFVHREGYLVCFKKNIQGS